MSSRPRTSSRTPPLALTTVSLKGSLGDSLCDAIAAAYVCVQSLKMTSQTRAQLKEAVHKRGRSIPIICFLNNCMQLQIKVSEHAGF